MVEKINMKIYMVTFILGGVTTRAYDLQANDPFDALVDAVKKYNDDNPNAETRMQITSFTVLEYK